MNVAFASASVVVLAMATAAPPAFAQGAGGQQLEEVVVTAQRREENVQKASVSIEALSGQAITERGVNDPNALNGVVPGLKIAVAGAGQVQTFIRGVGDVASNSYTQSSVSLNIDGVYVARSSAFGAVFYDTARVEVLRGPQGTLYGRNSSGGAINIITNAPKLDRFGGYLAIEGGNYDLLRTQGAANIPVTDSLAVRAAFQATRRDGYLSDGTSDDDSIGGRVRALWKPTDDLSILLTADLARVGGKGIGRVYRPSVFGDAWIGTLDPRYSGAAFPAEYIRNPASSRVVSDAFTGEVNWTLGGVTLTVIPAYRHVISDSKTFGDYQFAQFENSKQTSLEARLSANGERLKWVLGAYYFNEAMHTSARNDMRLEATISGRLQIQDFPTFDTRAPAVFGEATISLTDRLRLIAGARYTEEERRRNGVIFQSTWTRGVPGPIVGVLGPAITVLNNTLNVSATTWKVGGEYDIGPQNLLYLTASKGFKSGGWTVTVDDPFKPEYVTAYTFGSKNRFLSDSLQANLEVFYWKYADQQVQFTGVSLVGVQTFLTRNAGQATIKGADLDLIWKFTPKDTLDAGVEYLKTNYDEFLYGAPIPAGTVAPASGLVQPDNCISRGQAPSGPQYLVDCTGQPLQRAPEWSGNARYSHRFDLADGASLTASGTVKFETDHFLQLNYSSQYMVQKTYEMYDADLTYHARDGRWTLMAYVRNIGNQVVYLQASNDVAIPPATGPQRTSVATIAPPRTYGLRFQANF